MSSKVKYDGVNQCLWVLHKVLPRVKPLICRRFRGISNQRILMLTNDPSRMIQG